MSKVISMMGVCALVSAAQVSFATDPAAGTGAKAQAQVGTGGATAGAQVGTPTAQPQPAPAAQGAGVNTQVNVKTQAGVPVSGALTVKDPTLRTFVIEGTEQVYVAPETVDIQKLQGQDVTVTFDENGRVIQIELDS
jgi:hypothetical protein